MSLRTSKVAAVAVCAATFLLSSSTVALAVSPQQASAAPAAGLPSDVKPGVVAVGEGERYNVPGYSAPQTADAQLAPSAVTAAAAPIFCKRTQDQPHMSSDSPNGYTINTHLRGTCPAGVVAHDITGTTYRSRWFGWEQMKTGTGTGSLTKKALNLPFACKKGEVYSYRTEGRYYSAFTNGYRGVNWDTTSVSDKKCTFRQWTTD